MSVTTPIRTAGLFESLSRLAAGLLAVAHTRLELFSVDLSEAQEHLLGLLLTGLAAVFALGVGLVLATFALILLFWDSHRLLALGVIATIYLGAGLVLAMRLSRQVREAPQLFSASLAELSKDRLQLDRLP